MKKYTLNYSALLTSIVLVASPLSSQADMHKGQMMMNDNDRGEMMEDRGRYSENYAPRNRMGYENMGPMGQGMGRGYMGHGDMMGRGMGHGGMMHGMRSRINAIGMLDLDSKQRTEIRSIQREQRKSRWQTMGQIMDEKDKLLDLYDAGTRDKNAIGKVYSRIFNLKRQMIEANIDAGNKARSVLSDQQRKELDNKEDRTHHRSRMGNMGMGGHMMRR